MNNESILSKESHDKSVLNYSNLNTNCLACHKEKISYECFPCRHKSLCKDCAKKLATGGKCKVCHEFFVELRRIV